MNKLMTPQSPNENEVSSASAACEHPQSRVRMNGICMDCEQQVRPYDCDCGICNFCTGHVVRPAPARLACPDREAMVKAMAAQYMAHRAVGNQEIDPDNGKLAGYCLVCQIPWPCDYAKPVIEQIARTESAELAAITELVEAANAVVAIVDRKTGAVDRLKAAIKQVKKELSVL